MSLALLFVTLNWSLVYPGPDSESEGATYSRNRTMSHPEYHMRFSDIIEVRHKLATVIRGDHY